jgi:hypothetical protein
MLERNADPPRALLDLARVHTTGEVSPRRHHASRSRVLDRGMKPARSARLAYVAVAGAMALGATSFAAVTQVRHHDQAIKADDPNGVAERAAAIAAARAAAEAAAAQSSDSSESSDDKDDPLREDAIPPTVTIRVMPDEAKIFWDDQPLEGNPAKWTRPPDGKVHRIRAEAPGYKGETDSLVVDHSNYTVQYELEPVPLVVGPISATGPVPDVSSVVEEMRSRFRDCYQEGLADAPSMSGKAKIILKVAEGGRILSSDIAGSDGLSAKVTTCLAYVASDAHFAKSSKGSTVVIPVSFRPR